MEQILNRINYGMKVFYWFHYAREEEPGMIAILTHCETWTDAEILACRCFHGIAAELRVYRMIGLTTVGKT